PAGDKRHFWVQCAETVTVLDRPGRRSSSTTNGRSLVIRDAAALIADASLKGLLDGGLTRLWEIKVQHNDISFWRTLDCIESSLANWIVPRLKGSDIHS